VYIVLSRLHLEIFELVKLSVGFFLVASFGWFGFVFGVWMIAEILKWCYGMIGDAITSAKVQVQYEDERKDEK